MARKHSSSDSPQSLSQAVSEFSAELHKAIDPPLLALVRWIDSQLQRSPRLYRRLSK